ncbi:hypothetical protein SBY92_003580 [Candida maltosa Xu316]
MPGIAITTIVSTLLIIPTVVLGSFGSIAFLGFNFIGVIIAGIKALEIDFLLLTAIIIYLLFLRDNNTTTMNHTDPSVMNLPNELIDEIIGYLNHLDKSKLSGMNRRLDYLVKKSLLRTIYVNNGGPKIVVSSNFNSPFYRQFTIMSEEQFKRLIGSPDLSFVRKIVFYSDDHVSLRNLQIVTSKNISVTFEHSSEKRIDVLLQKKELLWITPDIPVDQTITQLSIDYNGQKISSQSLSQLNLQSLKINNVVGDSFDEIDSHNKLEIGKLSLEFADKQPSIVMIHSNFDVEKIVSLELKFKTRPHEDELIKLMGKLKSLTNLALMCQNIRFDRVLEPLEKNTLQTFYVNVMGRFDSFSSTIISEILKNQKQSIQKISWSNKRLSVRSKSYGLDDFERLYESGAAAAKDQDIAEIKTLISNGFDSITDVISNELYYKVYNGADVELIN